MKCRMARRITYSRTTIPSQRLDPGHLVFLVLVHPSGFAEARHSPLVERIL